MKAILQTVLESREENEPYLYRTTWISDAYALGKYHTGTNLCVYRSFMALARIAEEVFGEKSYAEMLRSEAGSVESQRKRRNVILQKSIRKRCWTRGFSL